MNIIILGAGKVGRALCADLSEQHNVFMIDQRDELIETLLNKYDVAGIVGNGVNVDVQIEAGVKTADIFVATTESDEVNIIACALAKKSGAKDTIARVRNPEYAGQLETMKDSLGISAMMNPELSAAQDIVRTLRYASALSIQTLAGNKVSLVEIEVKENSVLDQMSLQDFRQKYGSVLVCIIERDGQSIIPSGLDTLRSNDKIFVVGFPKDMVIFHRQIGNRDKNIRSVFILGGGRIAYYLLRLLEQTRIDVKVIESDMNRCEELSVQFPFARVIHADGTDPEVMDEQSLSEYDAFVSLTGVDEENLIASIYAEQQGVRKVITKMSRTNILRVLDTKQLKKIVTPKNLVTSDIARFVRSRANAQGSNVEALYRVANNNVEVLQFKVGNDCHILNKKIAELQLKPNLLIAYIFRNGAIIFPDGQDSIQENDRIVVVTSHKDFSDLEDILEEV